MTTSERRDEYPPGDYISGAMRQYRVEFVAKRNSRQGMRNHWLRTMDGDKRLDLGK